MSNAQVWICPVCKNILEKNSSGYSCVNKHQYDSAKQGYVNLLLANKKKSKEPGDSNEMMVARSGFLEQGFYDFLVKKLVQIIGRERCQNIVDLGCGEGFYLRGLRRQLCEYENQYWGIDISRPAIKRSATRSPENQFAVASCVDIPVLANTIDIALSVFAPFDVKEVARILKPKGRLIRVSPGAKHLRQLKQRLYESAKLHEKPKPIQEGQVTSEVTIGKNTDVGNRDLQNLLGMTPLMWCGDQNAKKEMLDVESLNIDFEFTVQEIMFDG